MDKETAGAAVVAERYRYKDKLYLVIPPGQDFPRKAAALRMLADKDEGIGADRILVCSREQTIFTAYTASGQEEPLDDDDRAVLDMRPGNQQLRLTTSFMLRVLQKAFS